MNLIDYLRSLPLEEADERVREEALSPAYHYDRLGRHNIIAPPTVEERNAEATLAIRRMAHAMPVGSTLLIERHNPEDEPDGRLYTVTAEPHPPLHPGLGGGRRPR